MGHHHHLAELLGLGPADQCTAPKFVDPLIQTVAVDHAPRVRLPTGEMPRLVSVTSDHRREPVQVITKGGLSYPAGPSS